MDFGYEITIPMEDEAEHIGNMLLQFNLESKPLTQEKPFININRCIKEMRTDRLSADIGMFGIVARSIY